MDNAMSLASRCLLTVVAWCGKASSRAAKKRRIPTTWMTWAQVGLQCQVVERQLCGAAMEANYDPRLGDLGIPPEKRRQKIPGRDLEHEYDPRIGDLGRARGFTVDDVSVHIRKNAADLASYLKYVPLQPSTVGIKPEDVDLTGYETFRIPGLDQEMFLIYGSSGSPTIWAWRAWRREENGRHYVVVFEEAI